jgi:hypothetical protein
MGFASLVFGLCARWINLLSIGKLLTSPILDFRICNGFSFDAAILGQKGVTDLCVLGGMLTVKLKLSGT